MEFVALDHSPNAVSRVALGTMYFGTTVPSNVSEALLDFYATKGGNFIDTANTYCHWIAGGKGGESETVVGDWLSKSQDRTKFVISTKVGSKYSEASSGLSRDRIIAECEKSLRRLRTDYIDIYFAHKDDRNTPEEETISAFDHLIEVGKIRSYGLSNYRAWRVAKMLGCADRLGVSRPSAVQQWGTLLEPTNRVDLGSLVAMDGDSLDLCAQEGLVHMAYSPLLGGAYVRDIELPPHLNSRDNRDLVSSLRAGTGSDGSVNQRVLRAILELGASSTVVVGVSKIEQLRELLNDLF